MITFLIAADALLIAAVGFVVLYLCMLSILALFARINRSFDADDFRRIAFIVPAHDEEASIRRTVESLSSVSYPMDRFKVIVIADNCADGTAAEARRAGATVFERSDPARKSKGYALRWCFDRLLAETPGFDAFVVIDADTVVAPDFLRVMNFYLARGSRAVQCSDMAAPQPGVWSAEMTRLGFTLYNHARPLGRRVMNCSAGIRGNGMCFASETLRQVPWSTYSLNEDLEFGLILLLNGITVDFAPEATLLATMPADARNAESQRSRWEMGRFPVIRRYGPRLIAAALSRPSFRAFDAFVDLVTPPFVNLFAVVVGMTLVHAAAMFFAPGATLLFAVWCAVAAAGLIHVFAGLIASGADAGLYKAFIFVPRYAAWKILLYARSMGRKTGSEWVRTTRETPGGIE